MANKTRGRITVCVNALTFLYGHDNKRHSVTIFSEYGTRSNDYDIGKAKISDGVGVRNTPVYSIGRKCGKQPFETKYSPAGATQFCDKNPTQLPVTLFIFITFPASITTAYGIFHHHTHLLTINYR